MITTIISAVVALFRGIPRKAYGIALLVALPILLAYAGYRGVTHYGASEYQRGRKSVTDAATRAPTAVAQVRAADSTAKAKVDTIIVRVREKATRADSAVAALPPAALAIPEVRTLAVAVTSLTTQLSELQIAVDIERATARLRASVDSAALVTAYEEVEAQKDVVLEKDREIAKLKKGPTWRTVGKATALGIVLWEGGKALLRSRVRK